MSVLPEKGEKIFGYKVTDQTTVSMLGAHINGTFPHPAVVRGSCM